MKLKKLLAVLTISISVLSVSACAGRTSASNDAPPVKEESTESAESADKEQTEVTAEKDEEVSKEQAGKEEEIPDENDESDSSSDVSTGEVEPGKDPAEKIELPKSTGTEIKENDFVAEILEDDTAIITKYSSYEDECEGIPGEISGHTVVGIGKNAFSYKEFEDLVIPGTVLVIGDSAFSNTEIDGSIDLSGVRLIDDKAFFAAELPGDISIPDNTYVGEQAFGYCEKLGKVTLGQNVTLDN